jgi:hypothetical protein
MLIKNAVLSNDENRLLSYGIHPSVHDCTFAPSIADAYQGSGLGSVDVHLHPWQDATL